MAKERNLPQKTTFTSSDFIRVVGSDNASYKQQVSNVASVAVENAYLTPPTALSSGADLLTLAVGVYYTPSNDVANSLVNKPSDLSLNCRVEVLSRVPARREIIVTDVNNVWENQMDSASTWTGWKKRPTRSEVDALNSKTAVSVTAGPNVVIDENKSYKCGRVVFFNVKGHATANINNATLFNFSGATINPESFTFGIPIGDSAWTINGIAYGYIGSTAASGRIDNGKYFHISQAFLCS